MTGNKIDAQSVVGVIGMWNRRQPRLPIRRGVAGTGKWLENGGPSSYTDSKPEEAPLKRGVPGDMSDTKLRELIDERRAAGADAAADEPSHIHIPRPSRVQLTPVAQSEDETPVLAQLDLALDDAA